jgi:hypothetical protein
MSLWTPGGEVPVDRNRQPDQPDQSAPPDEGLSGRTGGPSLEDLSPEERARAEQMIAEMAEVQRQILSAPASQVVANHVAGLYELAALHLSQEEPRFSEAQLAIDAMAAVLDAVGDRLDESGPPLRQALTQLQAAFVQRRQDTGPDPSP